jgi:hypothetical protein
MMWGYRLTERKENAKNLNNDFVYEENCLPVCLPSEVAARFTDLYSATCDQYYGIIIRLYALGTYLYLIDILETGGRISARARFSI